LGAAPGGWIQVLVEKLGPNKSIIGIDLEEMPDLRQGERGFKNSSPHCPILLTGDITKASVVDNLKTVVPGRVQLVLSDMSPKLTGIRFGDVAAASALVEIAFEFAAQVLEKGGTVVAKIFPGSESDDLIVNMK